MDTASTVQQLIDACAWYPSYLWVFSQNVYSPFLYYTYLGCAIPALAIGIYVFINQRNNLASRLLLLTMLSLALWVFGSLITWASEWPSFVMFWWTMVDVIEPFVYFFAFYFTYTFIYQRDLPPLMKLYSAIPLLPTLILAPTPLMLIGFDLTNCDRNAFEGFLALYGYAIEILYVVLTLIVALLALKRPQIVPKEKRGQIILLTLSVTAFLVTFSLGNILELVTENWLIGQYGLLGAPLFALAIAYLIIKYEAFQIELFSAQAFMLSLWFLIFSLLFVQKGENVKPIVFVTLILFTIISWFHVKSIRREVESSYRNNTLLSDLENANTRLQDMDRTKSEFVSIASHQLRTPLTAIRGFAELMRDGSYGPVPMNFIEPLAHVEESVQNMAMTINDFLNVSRIESGTMQYEYTEFSLRAVTEQVTDDLKQFALKRGLRLEFHAETESPLLVHADEGKVRQILQNLIDNSIKYTPQGSVTVTTAYNIANKMAVVRITDTGIGMSAETLNIIFTKFTRATNANTANIYGTGLGLFIAREMAAQMKGRVDASSWGEGQGSTFTLELPVVEEQKIKL